MNSLVILSAVLACVVADVSHLDSQAPVLNSVFDLAPEGNFQYGYETGNGIAAQAQGVITKPTGTEYPTLEIRGGYRYTSPDGTPIEVSYISNQNGYQPSGNAIPTAHPIPEYIVRSIEYNAAHSVIPAEQRQLNKPTYG